MRIGEFWFSCRRRGMVDMASPQFYKSMPHMLAARQGLWLPRVTVRWPTRVSGFYASIAWFGFLFTVDQVRRKVYGGLSAPHDR